jgi:Uma2 family endonuclease
LKHKKKSNEYFDAGIKSYWIVAPDVETIFIYRAKNQRVTFSDKAVLKDTYLDVELSLVDIFA